MVDRRRERGQSTVELAFLLPVVVVLGLAVVQVGLVSRDHLLVHHAAREAARRAAVEPDEAAALAAAQAGAPSLAPDRLKVQLSGARRPGERLTVEVRYRSTGPVPLVGRVAARYELSARVTVRVE